MVNTESKHYFSSMQSINNYFKNSLVRQRPVSIVFSLSLQMVGILIIGLISVNLCTIAQINQYMSSGNYLQDGAIWHIGMFSLMSTTIFLMPMLVGAIVFVILRSLRPLQKFTDAIAVNSFNQNTQTNFRLTEMPVEIRPLLRTYNKLVSTISEAGIQQQKFIATLSHELRTSLTLISGYLQSISRRNINLTKSQQEALDIVTTESEHIIQILQDSLELARVKNCCLPLNFECLILNDVVNDAVKMTKKFQHRIIQVAANSEKIMLEADRDRLLQVLIHLIEYTIQRSESHQPITLNLEQKDDLVIVRVNNTPDSTIQENNGGLGISQISHQPIKLYDAHSQENLDLKLEIIDTLIRRMGGNVFIQSHSSQRSDFWIRFPTQYWSLDYRTKNAMSKQ
ncbi:histidine kinase dimerization/phospho-acceptor domain-containing protein [Floridanema evergladense]|uniref:histidine kinase n=1 Tax=Floridaenema evergladense BLCC-F167 TaxID=3153639 RepID=A0ABV4WIM7_9CYAN